MAGTFSNDMTLIEDAEVLLDYSLVGSLKTARALNDDYKIEGTNATTFGVSSGTGVGTIENLAIVPGAPVDFSASAAHMFQWIKAFAWPSASNHAAGGLRISISSDAPPTAVRSVLTATVTAGGTGYTLNDELTLVGGTQTQAAVFTVTGVSGGVVTAVSPKRTARGMYTVLPTNPISTTGGTGSGCTLTLTGTGNPPDGWIYTTTNTKEWFVGGPDTVVVDGWVCYVVEINGTPDLQAGTPVMTSIDRMGLGATAIAVSKIATHAFDVSRYGTGITVNDGTSGSPVTFEDFRFYDNANARAQGVITSQAGIFFLAGKLYIGTTGQTAITYFKDTSQTVVFQAFPVATTFYEIKLAGAASFNTTLQLGNYSDGLASGGVTIKGSNRYTSYGGVATGLVTSVWTLTASAANQTLNIYASTLSEMLSAALSSTTTWRANTIVNSGTVTANGTLIDNCTFQDLQTTTPISATYAIDAVTAVPTITNCKFVNCATALRWPISLSGGFDPNGKLDGTTFISGSTGHAIEFTGDPTSRTLTNVTFSGYSGSSTNAAIYVNTSAGSMTLTIGGTGTDLTGLVRVAAGVTCTVIAGTKTVTVSVVDVDGVAVTGSNVFLRTAAAGALPYLASIASITRDGTTATVTHDADHNMVNDDKVLLAGITDKVEDNAVFTITKTGATTYTYQTTDSGSTSYTGATKTATFVYIKGNATFGTGSNEISLTRAIASSQSAIGWARKGSGVPYYKTGPISGPVSSTANTPFTAVLISDE